MEAHQDGFQRQLYALTAERQWAISLVRKSGIREIDASYLPVIHNTYYKISLLR
jgi:hypothetical protein